MESFFSFSSFVFMVNELNGLYALKGDVLEVCATLEDCVAMKD